MNFLGLWGACALTLVACGTPLGSNDSESVTSLVIVDESDDDEVARPPIAAKSSAAESSGDRLLDLFMAMRVIEADDYLAHRDRTRASSDPPPAAPPTVNVVAPSNDRSQSQAGRCKAGSTWLTGHPDIEELMFPRK